MNVTCSRGRWVVRYARRNTEFERASCGSATLRPPRSETPSPAEALRLAAALDLTDARMTAILHGSWGAHASILRGLSPAHMLLVNPPTGVTSGDGISIVRAPVAPVAAAWADAAALDRADGAMAESIRATLRGGGRLLARADVPILPGFGELARDADVWVAQLDAGAVTGRPGRHLAPRSALTPSRIL